MDNPRIIDDTEGLFISRATFLCNIKETYNEMRGDIGDDGWLDLNIGMLVADLLECAGIYNLENMVFVLGPIRGSEVYAELEP
jgi:hypothetical protein